MLFLLGLLNRSLTVNGAHPVSHTHCPYIHKRRRVGRGSRVGWIGVGVSHVSAQEIQLSRQRDSSTTQPPLSTMCPPTVPAPLPSFPANPLPPFSHSPNTTKTHWGPFAGLPFMHPLPPPTLFPVVSFASKEMKIFKMCNSQDGKTNLNSWH